MHFIQCSWFCNLYYRTALLFTARKNEKISLTVAPVSYIGNKTHTWFIWYCILHSDPFLKPSTAWKLLYHQQCCLSKNKTNSNFLTFSERQIKIFKMDLEFYIVEAFFCFSSLNFMYEWKIITISILTLQAPN